MSKLTTETNKYGQVRIKVETTELGHPYTYSTPKNTGLSGQIDQVIMVIVDKINEMDEQIGNVETMLAAL